VGEFAADLRAWLERRPITARAPSIAYQIKMFISRQRVAVGFASAIAVVLAITGAYSQTQRAEAAAQRVRAEEVQIFMANILSEAEPEGVKGEAALTAKGLLDAGVKRAREDYAEKQLVRGEMLAELARVYLRIGENKTGEDLLKEAIALIEKSAPTDEPSLHIARSHLGGQLMGRGEGEREPAVAMLTSVLVGCTRETTACLGAKGNAYSYLADDSSLSDVARLSHARQALAMFDKSFGPNSSNMSMTLLRIANLERMLGNFSAATEQLGRGETLLSKRRMSALEHYFLGSVKSKLAFDKGEYAQASVIIDRMLIDLAAQQQPEYQMYFYIFAANIANHRGLGKIAITHAVKAKTLLNNETAPLSLAYGVLHEARAHSIQGDYVLAERRANEVFDILLKAGFDEKSDYWLDGMRVRAEINARRGYLKIAREQLESTRATFRERYPTQFIEQVHVLDALGAVALAMGDAASAHAYHEEEAALLNSRFSQDHPLRLRAALQQQRAQSFISADDTEQKKLVGITERLKSTLPPESAFLSILEVLASSEPGSEKSRPQLVLLF
jgi:hypothetical protein